MMERPVQALKPSNTQTGFTLLELLLVIGLISSLTYGGMQWYQTKKRHLDVDVSVLRINRMHQALSEFYAMYCLSGSNPVVSNALLRSHALLFSDADIQNPFGGEFLPSIRWSANAVTASVSANIEVGLQPLWTNKLPPTTTSGTLLTWTRLPMYTTDESVSEQRFFTSMYHTQECR